MSAPESSVMAQLAQKQKRLYFSLLSKRIENLSKLTTSFMISSSYRWQAEIAAEYVAKYARVSTAAVIVPDDANPGTNLMITAFSKSLLKKSTSRLVRLTLESEKTLEKKAKEKLSLIHI